MSTNPSSLYQRAFSPSPTYASNAYPASFYGAGQGPDMPLATPTAFQPTTILGAHDSASSADLSNGQSTHIATPTLFGTGAPGDTLQLWATATDHTGLMLNSYPLGSAVVQADGTWQFSVPPVPQSALYDFQVTSSQGQSANFRLNISDVPTLEPVHHDTLITGAIDHVGPVTGELHNGATTDDTRPTFHGTGNPGELLNVNAIAIGADGKASAIILGLGTALVQPDGTWQFTAPQALGQGTYDVYVGHGAIEGEAFRLTIDSPTTAPDQPVQPDVPALPDQPLPHFGATVILGALDDSGAAIGHATHDATPTLYGTGNPGEVLHLWATVTDNNGMLINGFALGETQVKADGSWQFEVPQLAQGGNYDFQVDSAHSQPASLKLTLIADSAPVAPVQHDTAILGAIDNVGPTTGELANGDTTDAARLTFHGTGQPGELLNITAIAVGADGHPAAAPAISLGMALVQQDGTWQLTANQPLKEGTYDFHAGYGPTEGAAFRLVIDQHLPQQAGASVEADGAQHLQGLELDLSGHSFQAQQTSLKATLPTLGSVLETGHQDLAFAGQASGAAPAGSTMHHGVAEIRPLSLDELNVQHAVL
jgi:hypothetical protein